MDKRIRKRMERGIPHGKTWLGIAALTLFSSAFFWRCANIGAPQGGPKDTIPPKVMGATPAFNTTNFTGTRIYITFDEYVQLKDQQKEFFTSPQLKKTPTLLVKGRGVQIDILDTLKPNTTYALNFGSSVCDNNEGNPLNGFRYVFSTGPEIDSMFMSGYTVDAYKKDSVKKTLIFFYDAADSAFLREPFLRLADPLRPDSLPAFDSTVFNVKPDAIARAENNGIFIAQNLKPIDYRVYAIEDTNGNLAYEPGVDKIGFLDGVFNPSDLPDFMAWYDTTRRYMTAEPQLFIRMFTDRQFKRQNLAEQKRPLQHKIELYFNAPYPQIDSLVLDGIDSSRIITEYVTPGRDTINLWLDVPGEELPDTITGRITYLKHDSLNQLVPNTDKLKLFWKYIETKEEERAREKEEKERERAEREGETYTPPEKPNPFKYNLSARGEINPEDNVTISFDYPLVEMDSSRISLVRFGEGEDMYRVRYEVRRDSVDIRKWMLSAQWIPEQKYQLVIPDSVFLDVAGQRNDSIKADFSILSPDKFGTLTVNVKGQTDSSRYILQLLNDKNSVLQEKRDAVTGKYIFRYVNPGDVKLRVIDDVNGNGQWDTGDLILRKQPERVEIYIPESGNEMIAMKANWDIEITVDMADLFKPVDIMDIREQLRKQELLRAQRLIEERIKKAQQQQQQQNTQRSRNASGAFNPTGAFNTGNRMF